MEDEPKGLIREAFGAARRTNRPDWHLMTIAVLKNRLLVLTDGKFNESDYGAITFSDFVRQHMDVIDVDWSVFPPVARLRKAETTPGAEPESTFFERTRIRGDLWRAVLDYEGGHRYVWDASRRQARPAEEGDEGLDIPTATREIIAGWREKFVEETEGTVESEVDRERLHNWMREALGTRFLPYQLQGAWSGRLKDEVENTLRGWFRSSNLEEPSDLTYAVGGPSLALESQARINSLRDLIVECTRMMSLNELRAVNLPASVVERVLQRRRTR